MVVVYVIILFFINLLSYTVMWFDKSQAIKKRYRVPEKSLLLLALCFGALGIYLGMKAPLFHKASKLKFKILIPTCIFLNAMCVYLLF
jgi:uncharacterized membrane protein YsdA (DUF1294 family)